LQDESNSCAKGMCINFDTDMCSTMQAMYPLIFARTWYSL
jgi:hypothetical protein